MIYARPQRQYRNEQTGKTSFLLYEVIGKKATLTSRFNCGLRQGTWHNTPFEEIENVPPLETIPNEIISLQIYDGQLSDLSILFDAICDSIEQSWRQDKFHIVFHSSGWDSRIISAAIKRLVQKNGQDWLGLGLLFLANRWEAKEAKKIIINRQGWDEKYFLAYNEGKADEHFATQLDFDTFWLTNNPPVSIPGNLWWYLPQYAQELGLISKEDLLQGYCGLFANETWRWFRQGGLSKWLEKHINWYYYTTIAMHPQLIPQMEYPLTDINVLKLVKDYKGYDGDGLREEVANFACPEARDIPHLSLDDRGHKISRRLQNYCTREYRQSWYGKSHGDWQCPSTSEFSAGWCQYGLASLYEELIRHGVNVK